MGSPITEDRARISTMKSQSIITAPGADLKKVLEQLRRFEEPGKERTGIARRAQVRGWKVEQTDQRSTFLITADTVYRACGNYASDHYRTVGTIVESVCKSNPGWSCITKRLSGNRNHYAAWPIGKIEYANQ